MSSVVYYIPNWPGYYKIHHTCEYGWKYISVYSILHSYKNNDKTKPMNLTTNLWNYTLPLTLRTSVCSSWFHYLSPPLDRFNNNSKFLCSLFFCFHSINSFVHYTWTLICIFFWFWIDIFILCDLWFSFSTKYSLDVCISDFIFYNTPAFEYTRTYLSTLLLMSIWVAHIFCYYKTV